MANISCIVVCHNESLLLVPTINSVKQSRAYAEENGLTIEVHLVVDCADQETNLVVDEHAGDDWRVHRVDFGDLALSRNHGINSAAGEYIALVDGDDLWCESWLLDAYLCAESNQQDAVYHPEYNFVFGNGEEHVFMHVDMEDPDFEFAALFKSNYWTALSFAKRSTYVNTPFEKNRLSEGFGFEDWTWNYKVIGRGVQHKVVSGTSHYIRRKRQGESLLSKTNQLASLPSFLPVYHAARMKDRAIETKA